MTYEAFKKELYRNLRAQEVSKGKQVMLFEKGGVFTDEDQITIIRLINLAGHGREDTVVREDMLCVVWKNQGIVSMLHWSVRPIYERFKKEGWQGVLPPMAAKMNQSGRRTDDASVENYVPEREHLIIRPLHYPYDREELEDGICWRFGDIALVLYLLLHDNGEEFLTMKVNRDMAQKWDMTDEGMLTNALLNTCAKMPPRLYYGTDIRFRYDKDYGVFMPGEKGKRIAIHPDNKREGLRGYLLTTTRRLNGAVALFYPGVKERLAELLGGDYYVGFTSIHEAVVYPALHKVLPQMKAAIQRTNIMFDRREMLTNRVYRYSSSRKELIEV